MSLKLILLIMLAEVFICTAQFMFKAGANKVKHHKMSTVKDYVIFIKASLKVPAIWVGLVLNALSVVVWIVVLALVDLSLAIPLDSIHYVVILIGAHLFLKEKLSWEKIAATVFIFCGILLVAIR